MGITFKQAHKTFYSSARGLLVTLVFVFYLKLCHGILEWISRNPHAYIVWENFPLTSSVESLWVRAWALSLQGIAHGHAMGLWDGFHGITLPVVLDKFLLSSHKNWNLCVFMYWHSRCFIDIHSSIHLMFTAGQASLMLRLELHSTTTLSNSSLGMTTSGATGNLIWYYSD